MEQFQYENIEVIWGLSKDHNLGEGEVKVTVLATGFGMKDIPDMKPLVEENEQIVEQLTREELERIAKENEKLDSMVEAFYKPDYKVYIFKGDEMHNDEFLTAIDNSPTYSRTASELEKIIAILDKPAVATIEPETVIEEAEAVYENEENDNN
jgi:cell division protein FtsZ